MIKVINSRMNIDILSNLKVPAIREVMYAEVLIQGILSGRTVEMGEIEANFINSNMVKTVRDYVSTTGSGPGAES